MSLGLSTATFGVYGVVVVNTANRRPSIDLTTTTFGVEGRQ